MKSRARLSAWRQSHLVALLSPLVLRGVWQRHGIWNTLLWLLLAPFSLGFSLIVRGRNLLYDLRLLPSARLDATVVSVGNLTVGGTGKTPVVLWLARALQARGHRVGILVRGYKGVRTNDLVVVGAGETPLTDPAAVGDEAVMLAREFSGVVIAGRDRIAAAQLARKNFGVDIVILDDGFQHRRLARDMDILLVNLSQDISSHWLLPAGPLRESFSALRRAHAIILTKKTISARASRVRLRSWLPTASVPIFSGRLVPTALVNSLQRQRRELPLTFLGSKRVVAVCGIADPLPFYRALREWEAEIVEVFEFPDHHAYTHADWQMISLTAQKSDLIVTTEKDLVKLERFPFAAGKLVALQVRMDVTPAEQLLAMIERRAARKKDAKLTTMAAPFLIKAVTELLADVPAKDRTLLDVSCKEGDVLQALGSRGFALRGTNFEPSGPSCDGIPIDYGVDLLKPLPYADASFDVVLLIEVIEHLENHRLVLNELARILKPGGVLILTTPNIMRLNSRFHFFFSGYHKTKRRFIPFDTPLAQAYRFHNYPIDLPILYYLAKQSGLVLERLGACKVKGFSRLLLLLFGFPVAAYTWYTLQLREKDLQQRRENQRLLRWLLHPRTLMDDNLALRFRKVGEVPVQIG